MVEMVSIKDATVNEWRDVPTGKLRLSTYLAAPKDSRDPQFFTVDNTPHRHLPTHFHDSDQFQIIVKGTGTLGRHELKPFTVHYSRAFTPYGPIQAGPDGVTWATLRVERDQGGSWHVSKHKDKLISVKSRKPWQVSEGVDFDSVPQDGTPRWLTDIKDTEGLGGCAIRLKPGETRTMPSPAGTSGQFVVVARGSAIHDGQEKEGLAMSYVKPDGPALTVTAGAKGVDLIVLNFPKRNDIDTPSRKEFEAAVAAAEAATTKAAAAVAPVAAAAAAAPVAAARVFNCAPCGFNYDEAAGLPHEGIAPGTKWEDVPHDWKCPDCEAGKDDFTEVSF